MISRKAIYDIDSPDRGLCAIEGCLNLQHNHGSKRWGKLCGKHHYSPESIARRKVKERAYRKEYRGRAALVRKKRLLEKEKEREAEALLPRLCKRCDTINPASCYVGKRGRVCKKCKLQISRERVLKKDYGIDDKQYQAMVLSQGGVCAVCGELPNERGLVIDHCHDTDIVRGLLCDACNIGIGCLRDDLDILASAASYLINSRLLVSA